MNTFQVNNDINLSKTWSLNIRSSREFCHCRGFFRKARHPFILSELICNGLPPTPKSKAQGALELCHSDQCLGSQRSVQNIQPVVITPVNCFLGLFLEVNFAVPGSRPADSSRHKVLFLHYFCPGWLSNWIMNNIPAVIFNGLRPVALSCCLAF